MTVRKTKFGDVDASVLEQLQASFDPRCLLEGVAKLDQIRLHIDQVHQELLRLHRMTHDLIHDDATSDWISEGDEAIWKLADRLAATTLDWPEDTLEIGMALDKLAELSPEPDDAEDD